MIKYELIKLIEDSDFDKLIEETYGKPYCFQQQDGCKDRGVHRFSVPHEPWGEYPKEIEIEINGSEMGIDFDTWVNHDINDKFFGEKWRNDLFYERNFYPEFWKLVNDLYARGLIEKGSYVLNIDW